MIVATEKYDDLKVLKLKNMLEDALERGTPEYYEVYVNGWQVISRTNDASHFDRLRDYVNEDTTKVRVIFYGSSAASRKGKEYVLLLKEDGSKALQGTEINERITEEIKRAKEQWDYEQLKKDLLAKTKELEDAEQHIDKLHSRMQELKTKDQQKEGFSQITSLVRDFVPQLINPKSANPASLSGTTENKKSEGEASFKKSGKASATEEDQKRAQQFIKEMEESFDPDEMEKVIEIIRKFVKDPSQIKPVYELLNTNPQKNKT